MSAAWPMVPLGDVLVRTEEWIDLDPAASYSEVTVRLWGKGVTLRRQVTGAEIAAGQRAVVRKDQFIISRIDARNGASGLVPEALDGAVVSNDFPSFTVNASRLLPEYLGWLSKTANFVGWCKAASEGTTNRVRLKEDCFLATPIPFPPLAEQRRIVARIEALAERIAEAKRLRGEAVQEALALQRSFARSLFEQSPSTMRPIGEIADIRGGIQKSPGRLPGANPVRYLTVAHVQRNQVSTADPRFFEVTAEELERWRLCAGDVLIIEGNGSADQIGRTAIFRGDLDPCVHQNHVIRIRPDQALVAPEYLNAYLNSPPGQEAVRAESRTTSGLRTLSVGRIQNIRVQVPSLAEQCRIVATLDALEAKVGPLRSLQAETATELGALLPAVLAQAFAGQL